MFKYLSLFLLAFITAGFSQDMNTSAQRGSAFTPAFTFEQNDLELSRLAQPLQYFDKIGRRAGLMGYESGSFEMWVWPWKPLRNFELSFLLGTSTQPILAKDIVRTISVTPEVTTLTYAYESFTVRQHILIPRDEPGAILLLEVHTTMPLTIIPGFIPVMQPMWPAGIGGQFSYWDDEMNAYVISEGQWRAMFLCGSPAAQQMAAPPAHMFADNPLQFKIDVQPGEADGKFIPIVIAGALPDTATWRMSIDSVKATYTRLWKNAEKYYREGYDYFRDLRASTVQLETGNTEFDLAYEWGKVALDNLMVVNPKLGYGMVAGYGLSGGGARPGFAWFFGGDAFINSLAMNSYGDFTKVRDALAFTQKWQRQENYPIRKKNPSDPPKDIGKMSHELAQSDGLCDWWNDYRYGYNHADTSPWYILAMGDYARASGDVTFVKASWKSVQQAYDWCLSKDSDGDGLMDLKGAGLGALEFGKLVGIYADVYTCGIWVQAIKEMKYMAELVGDAEAAQQAGMQLQKAHPQLEKKFWMEKDGFYSYGATEKGDQVHEKTPWSGVAMMYSLLDEKRSARSIEAFNSADMCTDWGIRSLSNKSTLFEPTNYNYGAVWPFISSFFNTAQFKHNFSLAGHQILESVVEHAFDNALGMLPEVFSGEMNSKLGEAYHHQGFSTTGYMLPMIRGMLGLEVDALNRSIGLNPHLPADWKRVAVRNILIGDERVDATFQREGPTLTFEVKNTGPMQLHYVVDVPPGSGITGAALNGQAVTTSGNTFALDLNPGVNTLALTMKPTVEFILPSVKKMPGATNKLLKVVSSGYDEAAKRLTVKVEGLPGQTYSLGLLNSQLIRSAAGATVDNNALVISFPESATRDFAKKEIALTLE